MRHYLHFAAAAIAAIAAGSTPAVACTGLTLKSGDGAVVAGRTVEWSGSRYDSQYVVVPRGHETRSFTSRGEYGMLFKARYGYAGLSTALPQFIVDGINEEGLCCELFFFPGFGEYQPLDPAQLDRTIGDMQLVPLLLGSCRSLDDVREMMGKVRVTALEPSGKTSHWRITQADGKQMIIEIVDGQTRFYDSIGVLTNSPGYDWHLTNLSNYVNLHTGAAPARMFDGMELKPVSGGSGLLGLPGDFTSPSRFVRVAFYQNSARTQPTALATVSQMFQILNNFDIPIGTAYDDDAATPDMLTATQWTTVTDISNRRLYYRTGVNSTIRCIDLNGIDFKRVSYTVAPVDNVSEQPVEQIAIK